MYEQHFNLCCDPFAISPDPRFLYTTPTHAEALAGLLYGVKARKGVIALTGEVGTGKTLLLRCLMRALESGGNGTDAGPAPHPGMSPTSVPRAVCCYVFHSKLAGSNLLRYLLAELGVEAKPAPKTDLLLQLSSHLVGLFRQGVTPVLVLDEAQSLGAGALEEIRMLTNLETAEAKLLQVVLAGQPEFARRLDSHGLRQLRQRIVLRFELRALTAEQIRAYVENRLRLAGHPTGRLFSRLALERLYTYSEGIPRTINVLCGNALLSAYADQAPGVSADLMEEAAQDLRLVPATHAPTGRAVAESNADLETTVRDYDAGEAAHAAASAPAAQGAAA